MTIQCPPCTGNCNGARDCPAERPHEAETAIAALCVMAAVAIIVTVLWRILT